MKINNILHLYIYSFIVIDILGINFLRSQDFTETKNSIEAFVKIGHSNIFYAKKGIGSTAVVFISGLGENHDTWSAVQDSIANFATTLSYDRAGLGKSDYHNEPKNLISFTNELHSLVTKLQIPIPFIIVAHSLGCQIAKYYASQYNDHIQFIVFLDPGFNENILKQRVSDSVWTLRESKLKQYQPKFNPAQESELQNLNMNCHIADSITLPKNLSGLLYTATKINLNFPASKEELLVKKEVHTAWLQQSKNVKHIYIENSRHYIQNEAPNIVIDAVRRIISLNK